MMEIQIGIHELGDAATFDRQQGLLQELWDNQRILVSHGDIIWADDSNEYRVCGKQFEDNVIIVWVSKRLR